MDEAGIRNVKENRGFRFYRELGNADDAELNPSLIRGEKFRLAAIEITDQRKHGVHLVETFARFCAVNDDPNDQSKFLPPRIDCMQLIDLQMHDISKKYYEELPLWQKWLKAKPTECDPLELDIIRDLDQHDMIIAVWRQLRQQDNAYTSELIRPKTIIKPLTELAHAIN